MGAHILRRSITMLLLCLSFSFSFSQEKKINSENSKNEELSSEKASSLPTIIIKSPNRRYNINGDTISYPVLSYLKIDIKKAEDLFRQLEGFKVDDRGRIFFNGKEVNRVLVDGEDLVGDQYRILSKNIQAGLIDKVQVYTHYNQNRILKDVEHVEEVAIDLRFREDKKNKLNGSLETGFGNRGKHNIDIDAVGIFKKFKSVAFFDRNNIGRISYINDFSTSNGTAEYSSNEKNDNQPSPLEFPVRSLPEIPNSYIYDNRDQHLSLIGSFKAGRFKSIKIATSIAGLQNKNSGTKNIQFLLPGNESWYRTDEYRNTEKQGIQDFKVSYKVDNEQNRISNYEIKGLNLGINGGYSNKRQGVIEDSLYEYNRSDEKYFSFKGDETIKLRKGFIVHSEAMYAVSNLGSDLNATSLIPFYTPAFEAVARQQAYNSFINNKKLVSSVYRNIGKMNTRLSFHVNEDEKKMASALYSKYVILDHEKNNLNVNSSLWKTNGSIGYKASKKIFMQFDFAFGKGQFQFKGKEHISKGIFNLNYQLTHQKGPFNRWSSEISIARKMPSAEHIFPSPLLGHNSIILFGLLRPSFPLVKNIEINYQRSDFYRAMQFSGNIAGSFINNDNSTSFFNYPEYSIKSFFISNKIMELRSGFHFEKYFQHSKLKTIIESNEFFMRSPERINNIDTSQSILSSELKISIISNWKCFLNIESGSSISNNLVFGSHYDYSDKKSINLFRHFIKLKAVLGKNAFALFHFSSNTYNGFNTFFAGNGSIDWKINKSLHSSIVIHNLFNKDRYVENQNDLYGSISNVYFLQMRYILFSLQLSL